MHPVRIGQRRLKEGVSMYKAFSLALLVGGVALVIFGIQASNSFASDVSRFFTDSPTDKAIWMLVGGVMLGIVGLVGLLRGSKATA
jgi:drug/metabolite transporter (DMT)-like permease